MSPQSPRYPTPAGQAIGGRHHRPESLADVTEAPDTSDNLTTAVAVAERSETRYRRGKPVVSFVGDEPSPARSRSATRGQRPTRGGRHAVARPPAQRPPATGSHRAPGTLPIESWLLMGKARQQALLASLVAIGILLLAMPAEQRRDSVDAVNAAAQAVVGVQSDDDKKPAPAKTGEKDEPAKSKPIGTGDTNDTRPATGNKEAAAPDPTAAAPTVAPSSAAPVEQKEQSAPKVPGAGPGNSLRTTGTQAVSLTFDDGPDPVQTPRILALLDKHDVKAVFCLVGSQVKKHPEIVRQIVDAGHTLCNHTWDHSLTIGKDKPEKIKADLDRTNAAIEAAVPGAEIPFFRAPGGNFTDRLVSVAGSAGMTSLYWEVDPRDWDHPKDETDTQHVDRVVAEVQKNVKPGAIVLSHDFGQPDTIVAYEKLLPWLKANFTLGLPKTATPPPAATPTQTPAAPASATPTPPAGT